MIASVVGAAEGGYHIKADSVRLKGGAIASAADKDHNELTARSFSFEDIRNESSYSAGSMGIGAGYGGSLKYYKISTTDKGKIKIVNPKTYNKTNEKATILYK